MSAAILSAIRVENGIFWFDLTESIVFTIRQQSQQQSAQQSKQQSKQQSRGVQSLQVPRYLRRWLQKASVLDITAETSKRDRFSPVPSICPVQPTFPMLSTGLTFISRYANADETWVCVLETIVSLDGDVLNKVQKQFLDSEQAREMCAAHFWLIDQLLLSLRQDTDWLVNILTWIGLSLPVGLGIWSMGYDGCLELKETIAPLIGSGFSSLAYSVRDYWKPWIQTCLSRWGWVFLKKQLGFT